MADEANITSEEIKAEETEPHGTDWKAEARKWEARAKENKAAAEELEKMKRDQMTELEKAQADAAVAKAEAEQLKAEKERSASAMELSEKHGIPASMLMHCASVDDMAAFAEEWVAYHASAPKPHAAAMAQPQRLVKPERSAARTGAAGAIADFFSNR